MLQFARMGTGPLFEWSGIVQRTHVKPLSESSPLSNADLRGLIQFCFPTPEPMSGPLFFVFRLKLSGHGFSNVFCLLDQTSFQLRDLDVNQQCCLCLISPFYHFAVFSALLKAVRSLLFTGFAAAQRFLEMLRSSPRQVTAVPELAALYSAASSRDAELARVSAGALLRLPVAALGRLLIGLLTDTPIIIVSSCLSVLSTFAYGLVGLLAPLEWPHLFAPVLPASCLRSIHCPTPYIVGIHRLLVPPIAGCEVEPHLFVDLDDGRVAPSGLPELPAWAAALAGGGALASLPVRVMCGAAGVQPASAPRTTARRVAGALAANPPDALSFAGLLFQSATMRPLVDALRQPAPPPALARFFAGPGGLTSPAMQRIDEFPARKPRGAAFPRAAPRSDDCSGGSSTPPGAVSDRPSSDRGF
jgi:hypothetical protein